MDNGNGKCSALSNASVEDCRAMFNSTRRSEKTESLAGAAGTHGSLVSRFNTGRLLVVEIFEISRVSIRSIKSAGTERCDPQRSILHTSGHVALCRCWICHSSGMSSPLWWWSCGTYSVEREKRSKLITLNVNNNLTSMTKKGIATVIGEGKSNVSRILRTFQDSGAASQKRKGGRGLKGKTNARTDKILIRDGEMSQRKIRKEL
ncbi:hypothetical protein TNCV_3507201 [Trichonephila clavipes]|uniref:Uncharacterized protein n=1 Tax=Trichonephila clavipes TaxID=2585209 RepID=A0A8X6VE66_TRICX|nr:hypothetical protein TNCV_3507201 [Trichonephila clavipes]